MIVYMYLFTLFPSSEYIIDACSVERNRLLVSSSCIGGPKERHLPPHTLTKVIFIIYLFILFIHLLFFL